ncbi:MAG: apolipoprotein N-acyltransferase [Deltaproteobacteria bacterium]|jgi:apolipoprotein N-acyltransferase|nr:apolipoprotein N-acyltransferase [Deltaproteobacteria bacterium]MBW2487868.1 apolipoprotein N-acyltransferase [Deltaproteobacteria bacterium]
MKSDRTNMLLAAVSGLLLTGSFPKVGLDWLAWFALVPLLVALANLSARESFRMGFIAGLVHYLTLLYWVVPVMRTYGYLPWYMSVAILFLFAAVLALFPAVFSMALAAVARTPVRCLIGMPLLWVALEYVRTLIFTGFPWELLGHALYLRHHLIQIADLFGAYGVSFLIALGNAAVYVAITYARRKAWHDLPVSKPLLFGAIGIFVAGFFGTWIYGAWRIQTVDETIAASPTARVAVVQGNIDQAIKWDPAHQFAAIKKHLRLSRTAKSENPDLIVWPESATPFYLFFDKRPTEMVMAGIEEADIDFLVGSPSVARQGEKVIYFNSAYLISPNTKNVSKYDKTHLVPYGEYVPLERWLPFLGKLVAQVGDFQPGKPGKILPWKKDALGIQICYEVIFPALSRKLVQNSATLLINITNDAWFGTTSGPYQHFSMTIFRAVENRRALARAANTGISGFIDPVGRILASTRLLEEAALTRPLPMLRQITFYTRFGDLFALACLTGAVFGILLVLGKTALTFSRVDNS